MKKALFCISAGLLSHGVFFVNAQTVDTSLEDKLNEQELQELKTAQDQLKFQNFDSCDDMNSVLEDTVKKYKGFYPHYRGGPVFLEESMVDFATDDADTSAAIPLATKSAEASTNSAEAGGAPAEVSTTNLQKKGVDEPEILKSNGDNLFYFNQQEGRIYIIKTPLNTDTNNFNFDRTKIESEIVIPSKMYGTQLFIDENRLIVVGTRNIQLKVKRNVLIPKEQRTVVAVYDISQSNNPKLEQFHDIDGHINNMRRIGDTLYILTNLGVNYHRFSDASGDVDVQMDEKNLPKVYSVDENKNVKITTTDCSEISYVLPTDETMEEYNMFPQFTMVSAVNLESQNIETTVAFGNPGEIHMSQESLYLVQNHWIPTDYYYDCPPNFACIMPRFRGGQNYSLIHKFDVDGKVKYKNTNLVPGNMLTQYSMDEDKLGNFRILTSKRQPQQATDLYVLDPSLELVGSLTDIEPGEQFKASRYIDDKLYLVTFRQTDPLFVIDIEDITDPRIIGELKIPGFSTYLHPMGGNENGTQYLIGLGHDADFDGLQKGLQLAMYKVDYKEGETVDSKCGSLKGSQELYDACKTDINPDNIRVSQVDAVVLGDQGSRSEAMQNPRMFVMNSDFEVTLPMLLKEKVTGAKDCRVFYDSNGDQAEEVCYDIEQQKTTFAGLKSFDFDKSKGVIEIQSKDYQDLLEKTNSIQDNRYNEGINSRQMQQIMMRVGFLGDVLYSINNDFVHFFDETDDSFIKFDPILKGETVSCSSLGVDQCEARPECTALYGSSYCDGDICTDDYVFQECVDS